MDPIAETSHGRVRGRINGAVSVFRGVRYGASTGGANRFRPPQPLSAWAGVREAQVPTPSAPQLARPEHADPFFSWYSALQPISEDCLGLDIYSPGLRGKRAVMVWIHGGGWTEFAGTAPGFDGTLLARQQDVVVVTINHRLGVMGFLGLETDDERFADSTNAGMLDIVAALQWVRDNIASFGGDPQCVTVFGESGGASKIAALMAMSKAKGLFHRAIIQSSAGGMTLATEAESAASSHNLAAELGLSLGDAARWQDISLDAILVAFGRDRSPFRAAIDQRNFFEHPFADQATALSANVPLLIGCTSHESTYYLRDELLAPLDFAEVERRLSRFMRIARDASASLVERYRDARPKDGPAAILVRITTDFMFKRNTYRIADLQSELAGAQVYAYEFSWETPIGGGRLGAPHTVEVPFIFGTTGAARAIVGDGPELASISNAMMTTWASFARNGAPGGEGQSPWERYNKDTYSAMSLNVACEAIADPGGFGRAALSGLPYFGYGHAIPDLRARSPLP